MKYIAPLLVVLGMSFAPQLTIAQLDTLFFDDFVDNRNNWKEYSNERGSLAIKDGFLHSSATVGSGTYRLNYLKVPLPSQDSFLYEIRIIPKEMTYGGAVYNLNLLPNKKDKRTRFCCYSAMVTTKKGVESYNYTRWDGTSGNWYRKVPELNRESLTFRVTYGSGKYHCFLNGAKVQSYSYRPNSSKKHPRWERWGWLSRGASKYKVDYMLVMGKRV